METWEWKNRLQVFPVPFVAGEDLMGLGRPAWFWMLLLLFGMGGTGGC